jgi:hypothetical protein
VGSAKRPVSRRFEKPKQGLGVKGGLRCLEFLFLILVDRIEQAFLQAVDEVGAHVLDTLIE